MYEKEFFCKDDQVLIGDTTYFVRAVWYCERSLCVKVSAYKRIDTPQGRLQMDVRNHGRCREIAERLLGRSFDCKVVSAR